MNLVERLEVIIQKQPWIKNNMGMGRNQCVKLVIHKKQLLIIFCSDIAKEPLCAKVKKILPLNGKVILLYDGENLKTLKAQEFEKYKNHFSEDEWNAPFGDDTMSQLAKMNLISDEENFDYDAYLNADLYENICNDGEAEKLNCVFKSYRNKEKIIG